MKEYKPFKFQPITVDGLKFKQVDYHRNGISGDGFYCAVATDPENGDMLITFFPDIGQCACAVYKLDLLPNITFMENSWRGDHYSGPMEKAIKAFNKQMEEWMKED